MSQQVRLLTGLQSPHPLFSRSLHPLGIADGHPRTSWLPLGWFGLGWGRGAEMKDGVRIVHEPAVCAGRITLIVTVIISTAYGVRVHKPHRTHASNAVSSAERAVWPHMVTSKGSRREWCVFCIVPPYHQLRPTGDTAGHHAWLERGRLPRLCMDQSHLLSVSCRRP